MNKWLLLFSFLLLSSYLVVYVWLDDLCYSVVWYCTLFCIWSQSCRHCICKNLLCADPQSNSIPNYYWIFFLQHPAFFFELSWVIKIKTGCAISRLVVFVFETMTDAITCYANILFMILVIKYYLCQGHYTNKILDQLVLAGQPNSVHSHKVCHCNSTLFFLCR